MKEECLKEKEGASVLQKQVHRKSLQRYRSYEERWNKVLSWKIHRQEPLRTKGWGISELLVFSRHTGLR